MKVGAQSIDTEFMTSQSASYLLNSAMGWGALPAVNLPGGGPAYPLASLGVRGQYKLTDAVTALAGIYSGSPLPAGSDGSQLSNPSGIALPLNTGALGIAEIQYRFNGGIDLDPDHPDKAPDKYAGTYKLGGWYDTLSFDDLRYDNLGLPLASDFTTGAPASHHSNYSIYGLADQMVWQEAAGSKHYLSAFVRPMFTTYQDRSLVSFSVNGGLALHKPINRPNGDNDVFALGFGVVQVSSGAANFDRDMQFYHPEVFTPVQGAETFFEATYQAQVLPSVVIQPDIQYIINPGGGIANPNDPFQKVKNELVLGVRTNITF